MTTGEKLALLRKNKGITQEQMADTLGVSRQSVSRWEQDIAFPETDKLIKISKLLKCSIDFLLSVSDREQDENLTELSSADCYQFIRKCGFFFLATSVEEKPQLRPMGMIGMDECSLFLITDKRKGVYEDLCHNASVQLASYNQHSHKWLRVSGEAKLEHSIAVKDDMIRNYPMLSQNYADENEIYLAIFRLTPDSACIM